MQFKTRVRDGLFYIFILIIFITSLCSATEIMPFEDIEKGMRGVGYTVFQGTEISEFKVEILGALGSTDISREGIIIRIIGEEMERKGGISSGMSGSPIYVDGKLIGALAYKYEHSLNMVGLVTPIEDMLEILEYQVKDVVVALDGYEYELSPIESPLVVSGFSGRVEQPLLRLEKVLSSDNPGEYLYAQNSLKHFDRIMSSVFTERIEISSLNTSLIEDSDNIEILPGSAVGVGLMKGDMNVAAIGTVTYREDDRFLAFGHSFMSKGAVDLYATSAYVYTVVSSDLRSYKLSEPKNIIGSITQDRLTGISGIVGDYPEDTKLEINVYDKDINVKRDFSIETVSDPELVTGLNASALLNAIDSTINRIGQGTAYVSFTISGTQPEFELSRDNMFYSRYDVAAISCVEVIDSVAAIVDNKFKDVGSLDIKVDVSLEEDNKSAEIINPVVENEMIFPGDVIVVEVKLKPFRRDELVIPIEVQIPEDAGHGPIYITIRAGGEISYLDTREEVDQLEATEAGDYENFIKLVEQIENREKNNEIIIEFTSYPDVVMHPPQDELEEEEEYVTNDLTEDEEILDEESYGIIENNDEIYSETERTKVDEQPVDTPEFIERTIVKVVEKTEYVLKGWHELEIFIQETPVQ